MTCVWGLRVVLGIVSRAPNRGSKMCKVKRDHSTIFKESHQIQSVWLEQKKSKKKEVVGDNTTIRAEERAWWTLKSMLRPRVIRLLRGRIVTKFAFQNKTNSVLAGERAGWCGGADFF